MCSNFELRRKVINVGVARATMHPLNAKFKVSFGHIVTAVLSIIVLPEGNIHTIQEVGYRCSHEWSGLFLMGLRENHSRPLGLKILSKSDGNSALHASPSNSSPSRFGQPVTVIRYALSKQTRESIWKYKNAERRWRQTLKEQPL